MVTLQQRRAIGGAMATIGLIQVGLGTLEDDLSYALLGFAYALIGIGYLYFEGRNTD